MEAQQFNPKNKYQKVIIDKKTCICCWKLKSANSFYDHHFTIDVKTNECKKCKILIDKEYYKTKKQEADEKMQYEISIPYTDKENQLIADFIAKRDASWQNMI